MLKRRSSGKARRSPKRRTYRAAIGSKTVGTGPYVQIPTIGKHAMNVPPMGRAPHDVQYTLTLPCGAKYVEGGFSDVWILVTYDPERIRNLFDNIDDLKRGTRPNKKNTSAIYLVVHPESLSWVYPFLEQNDFYFHHYSNAKKDKETGLSLRATGRYVYCYNKLGKAQSYATSIQGVSCILKTTDNMFMGVLEKDRLKGISGALDIGQSLQDTIIAELLEEIGLKITRIESGALFRFGGHVQHKARDDLINDNMGKYVLTLQLTSTDVRNAFVSAANRNLLDKEVSGILMIPTSGPFTLDSTRIFDYKGGTITPHKEMQTWILNDLNAMYHAKIGSVVPGLVAKIHESKVAFSPGTLQIEKQCIAVANLANGIRVLTHGKVNWDSPLSAYLAIQGKSEEHKVIKHSVLMECIKKYEGYESEELMELLGGVWRKDLEQKHKTLIIPCINLIKKTKDRFAEWIVLPEDTGHSVSWIESLKEENQGNVCVESGSSGIKIKAITDKEVNAGQFSEKFRKSNGNLIAMWQIAEEDLQTLSDELRKNIDENVKVFVTGATKGNVLLLPNGTRKFTVQVPDTFVALSQTDEGKYESIQARKVCENKGVQNFQTAHVAGIGAHTYQVCDSSNKLIPEMSGLVNDLL